MNRVLYLITLIFIALIGFVVFNTHSTGSPQTDYESTIWKQLNFWRLSNDLRRYDRSEILCQTARERLPEIQYDWSHEGFDMNRWDNQYNTMSENLSRRFENPEDVVPAWIASPTHLRQMQISSYTDACVVCENNYCVLHLGKI